MAAACSAVATSFRSRASILLFVVCVAAFAAAFVAMLVGASDEPEKRRGITWIDALDLLSVLFDLLAMLF